MAINVEKMVLDGVSDRRGMALRLAPAALAKTIALTSMDVGVPQRLTEYHSSRQTRVADILNIIFREDLHLYRCYSKSKSGSKSESNPSSWLFDFDSDFDLDFESTAKALS